MFETIVFVRCCRSGGLLSGKVTRSSQEEKITTGKHSFKEKSILGAVHILRNALWGGGGLPDLLQYYIGGVSPIYYNITVLKGKLKVIILFQL